MEEPEIGISGKGLKQPTCTQSFEVALVFNGTLNFALVDRRKLTKPLPLTHGF